MKNAFIFILYSILTAISQTFAQDTIWVKEGDTSKMYEDHHGRGIWLFKDTLPDGHYCSYTKKNRISVELTFLNGKKEGIENRYFLDGKRKYATISWSKGEKHGLDMDFNGNGTVEHLLTYKNGMLHGPCIINWTEGEKNYDGFYKNNLRDSIWTYYTSGDRYHDTSPWIDKQYKYISGKPYLISAWDKNVKQTIVNGNGILREDYSYDIPTTTNYINGMKNGSSFTFNSDETIDEEEIFKNDLLIKKTIYKYNNKIVSISEWSYDTIPQVDTSLESVDMYISNVFYNEVNFNYKKYRNGNWVKYYPDGSVTFEGNYQSGNRIGTWNWNYNTGKPRIIADYTNNIWQHFDTNGKQISSLTHEFLTVLTERGWFLNGELDTTVLILSNSNSHVVTPLLCFHHNGDLEIKDWLECAKVIGSSFNSYTLLGDILTINILAEDPLKDRIYKFRILSCSDETIIAERIE